MRRMNFMGMLCRIQLDKGTHGAYRSMLIFESNLKALCVEIKFGKM